MCHLQASLSVDLPGEDSNLDGITCDAMERHELERADLVRDKTTRGELGRADLVRDKTTRGELWSADVWARR